MRYTAEGIQEIISYEYCFGKARSEGSLRKSKNAMGTVSAEVVLGPRPRKDTQERDVERVAQQVTEFHCTGFSKFRRVAVNPTELIMQGLDDYLAENPLRDGCVLGHSRVVIAAAESAEKELEDIYAGLDTDGNERIRKNRQIVIHFEVNVRASRFQLELQARNEATFSCPDEMGWAPIKQRVCAGDGDMTVLRQTTLPVELLVAKLKDQGFEVEKSTDAGRFICNWIYYNSLKKASKCGTIALFVHVPLASVVPIPQQLRFTRALLHSIAELPAEE